MYSPLKDMINYSNVITTRNFQDRLDTLESVQNADINVCSGGILGLGVNIPKVTQVSIPIAFTP
jgi:biotin synthase-like enzyme